MPNYYQLAESTDRFLLEDGSGALLLEEDQLFVNNVSADILFIGSVIKQCNKLVTGVLLFSITLSNIAFNIISYLATFIGLVTTIFEIKLFGIVRTIKSTTKYISTIIIDDVNRLTGRVGAIDADPNTSIISISSDAAVISVE